MNNINKYNSGFTMVETLVAIAILMISIVGPLTIAQKGLMAAMYARDQVTASFLAQEVMEEFKNVRDNSLANNKFSDFVKYYLDQENYNCASLVHSAVEPLSIDVNGKYTEYVAGTKESRFTRSYCLKQISTTNTANEIHAIVRVSWANGTVENEVKLENELFNIEK